MTDDVVRDVGRILDEADEADDALRAVVARVAAEPGVEWAAIAFAEAGALTIGPNAGEPNPAGRLRVPVAFGGEPVGELLVDGSAEVSALEQIAELVASHVLIGWDTGGQDWEP